VALVSGQRGRDSRAGYVRANENEDDNVVLTYKMCDSPPMRFQVDPLTGVVATQYRMDCERDAEWHVRRADRRQRLAATADQYH